MADNVTLPGTSQVVATDEITGTGEHAQIMKLGISADGDRTLIPADATNGIDVDVTRLPALVAGDNNIGNVDVVTMPGVVGTVADDATTPGSPVMVGGKAVETDGTDPTSVSAEDDVAILRTDRNRRMLVNDIHPNLWTAFHDETSAQTNHAVKAAPGANLSLYVTDIIISNGATAGTIKLMQDTAGTPVQVSQTYYFAINGGATINLRTPIRITANTNLGFTSATMTTHSIQIMGYTAP